MLNCVTIIVWKAKHHHHTKYDWMAYNKFAMIFQQFHPIVDIWSTFKKNMKSLSNWIYYIIIYFNMNITILYHEPSIKLKLNMQYFSIYNRVILK